MPTLPDDILATRRPRHPAGAACACGMPRPRDPRLAARAAATGADGGTHAPTLRR
jgi:hypothetical protein